jgi:hypothetical protein
MCSFSALALGYGVYYSKKNKNKTRMVFTMVERRLWLKKKLLQKVPIDRAVKIFGILQVLQFIGVVQRYLINLEGTNPQGFKFSMFSFILFGGIPLKQKIPQQKIFLACALVKILLYFLLMILCLIKKMFPSLL